MGEDSYEEAQLIAEEIESFLEERLEDFKKERNIKL